MCGQDLESFSRIHYDFLRVGVSRVFGGLVPMDLAESQIYTVSTSHHECNRHREHSKRRLGILPRQSDGYFASGEIW